MRSNFCSMIPSFLGFFLSLTKFYPTKDGIVGLFVSIVNIERFAVEELTILEGRNIRREDFDADKRPKAMTLTQWSERCLELFRSKRSWTRIREYCAHLNRILGPFPLSEITRIKIMEFRNTRLGEAIIRHGRPVEGKIISISTVNRETRCLLQMLTLAADEGLLESVPRVRLDSERHLARDRVLDPEEYRALLASSPRWLQRIVIAAYETSWDRGDLLGLTWDRVDWRKGMVSLKGGRSKTGIKARVPFGGPLFDGFQAVLKELKDESRRVPNTEGRVFTKDGRPIKVPALRSAFESAVKRTGIEDFRFKDIRHCAKTRWSEAGIPWDYAMEMSGHASVSMHKRYINPRDEQIKAVAARALSQGCNSESRPGSTDSVTS